MNYNFIPRIRFVLYCVCIVSIVIIGKLYYVQIIKGDDYSSKANRQYVKLNSSNFDRGSIFFTSKDGIKVAAASIKDGYTLSINPRVLNNHLSVYESLLEYIEIDKDDFLKKASKPDDSYEEIQKKIDKNIGQSIISLKIPGVNLVKESWRIYPGGYLASHTVGLMGLDRNNILAGRYGLESYYNDLLSRKSSSSNINSFAEIFSGIKNTVFNYSEKEGDIVTSIDPTVQSYLENIILEIKNKWKSDTIGGIIMDPKTGEIYSMASLPNFNSNNLSSIKDLGILSNPLVESSYEVGSIIKPLTVAAGIDSGAISTKFTYKDDGFLLLNGKKISNHDGKSRGIVPVQEILSQSLNVGVATIALKMGAQSFVEYFLNYGFGEKTGIDQPNEQMGIIKNLISKRDVEIATASYGQGIAMTPIQTIHSLSVLANDGAISVPHIAKSIEYTDGSVENIIYPESKQVLKKKTVEDVTSMLVKVVDSALKKGNAKMEHYSIAAKTGTAQIADPVNGGYYKNRYLHSFFGYFPAYNPKFIVFLYQVNPKGAEFASETLTDPFIKLTKLLINYYEISPDR